MNFACTHCNWRGENPSTTEDSYESEDLEGRIVKVRNSHYVCPKCYQFVQPEKPS